MGEIFERADTYDAYDAPPHASEELGADFEVFEAVWAEAEALRASGVLVQVGRDIACPVVAIHGDYDSHPVAGIAEPLASVLTDFRLVLLEHCGHEPWIERQARDTFFRVLRDELSS